MIETSRRATLSARVKGLAVVVEGLIGEYRDWIDDARAYQEHLENIADMLEKFAGELGDVEPPYSLDDEIPF